MSCCFLIVNTDAKIRHYSRPPLCSLTGRCGQASFLLLKRPHRYLSPGAQRFALKKVNSLLRDSLRHADVGSKVDCSIQLLALPENLAEYDRQREGTHLAR